MRARKLRHSIAVVLFMAGSWLWTGAKIMMDWVGRSTVIEDLDHAQGLLARGAEWLFSTPPWVPAALATILTIAFIFHLVRTEKERQPVRGTARDELAHEKPKSERFIEYHPQLSHRRISEDGKH